MGDWSRSVEARNAEKRTALGLGDDNDFCLRYKELETLMGCPG